MATVILQEDTDKKATAKAPGGGKGVTELIFFPSIHKDLDPNAEDTIQQVWALEAHRFDSLLEKTKKYDDAVNELTEAQAKIPKTKDDDGNEVVNASDLGSLKTAQDKLRGLISEEENEEDIDPVPQGGYKSLIEGVGLVSKRTFYASIHDLIQVNDEKHKRSRFEKFKFPVDLYAEDPTLAKSMKFLLDEMETDSTDGTTDEKQKKQKEEQATANKGEENKNSKLKEALKKVKTEINEDWNFGKTDGTLKLNKINNFIPDPIIRGFLNDENAELIDNAVTFFNETANFNYEEKEQKRDKIKTLLEKEIFDHHDWNKVLLLIREIWAKTDETFVDEIIKVKYIKIPLELEKRKELIEEVYEHSLPKVMFDASGGAQLMRYSANAGGVANFNFTDGKASASVSAEAKFSLAEAGVQANLYLPDNNGIDLEFSVEIETECFDIELKDSSTNSNTEAATFAHNSSFMNASAALDVAMQLQSIVVQKTFVKDKEVFIQVVGQADTTGDDDYNKRMGYRRANATHAFFTNNTAQWNEYFEDGIWGDEERDMIYLSGYMMENYPEIYKKRFLHMQMNDNDKLKDILVRELKLAVKKYKYPHSNIISTEIKSKVINDQNANSKSLDGGVISGTFPNLVSKVSDKQLIETYFKHTKNFIFSEVPGISEKDFKIFYIDTLVNPILSDGENNLNVQKEGRVVANRTVGLNVYESVKKRIPEEKTIKLGQGRFHVEGSVSGFVGASINLSGGFEVNTYNGVAQLTGKKEKTEEKATAYNGKQLVATDKGKNNPSADVSLFGADAGGKASAFAGAKAEASLSIALEWTNPEKITKGWGVLASVGGAVTGTAGAGLEGEFKIGFDQKTGTFQIKVKANATWGLGGGGAMSFSVGIEQLYDFVVLVYHKLEENDFNILKVFEKALDSFGEATESRINVFEVYTGWILKLWQQKDYFKTAGALMGSSAVFGFSILQDFNDFVDDFKNYEENRTETEYMAANVIANSNMLNYVPPKVKGRMLYQLAEYKYNQIIRKDRQKEIDVIANLVSGDLYADFEEAALIIIESITHGREWQETMEHMAVKALDGTYKVHDETTKETSGRFIAVQESKQFLQNELLTDTDDWKRFEKHIKTIKNLDKAWIKEF